MAGRYQKIRDMLFVRNLDNQEEDEEDQAFLADLDSEIVHLDLSYLISIGEVWRPPTAEDYQIYIETERIRPPEIVFQPSIIGLEQSGLLQVIEQVLNLLNKKSVSKLSWMHLLTGGSSLFPNFKSRLEKELKMIRRFGISHNIVQSHDPMLNELKGPSSFSKNPRLLSLFHL